MRILVLGAAGFIGSNLVRRCLRDHANRVVALDCLDPRLQSTLDNLEDIMPAIEFVRGDIRDAALMMDLVEKQDIIFNCAAQTSHTFAMSDPLFDADVNCIGNLRVLEALRAHDPDRRTVVVYTSSSTAVGPVDDRPIDETHLERPLDIYSANKCAAEKYYRIYHHVHDIKTVVLRFANVYGPYGKGSPAFGFVNYFIQQAFKGADITVYGGGEQKRNVLFVGDAVEILYRSAFDSRLIGTLHFAVHDEHLSVQKIAHSIVTAFGRGRVVHIDWPEDRHRIEIGDQYIVARGLRELTGWHPQCSFERGLVETKRIMHAE